jgi:predicted TPR repeat methyltransferase
VHEIIAKVGGKEVTLQFKEPSLEESIKWASKLRAKSLLKEALQKSYEKQLEIDPTDDEKVEKLAEKCANTEGELVAMAQKISDWITHPPPDEVQRLLKLDVVGMVGAFNEFTDKLFPKEEDEKKS